MQHRTIVLLIKVLVVWLFLASAIIIIGDRAMPFATSVDIPGGAIQLLRRDNGVYIETWFLNKPRVMVTVPTVAAAWATLSAMYVVVGLGYWLLWRERHRSRMDRQPHT